MYQTLSKTKLISFLFIGLMYFSLFTLVLAQETATTSIESNAVIGGAAQNLETREASFETRANTEAGQDARTSTTVERQETTATTTGPQIETRTENQENKIELREERQAVLQEVRQKRVINLSANISNRMEAAIERFGNITTRLDSRIDKMTELGMNTNESNAKLSEAKASLASARFTLGNIDNLVFSATTSEKPVSDWKKLREVYLEAGREIRQAQLQIREVVAILKQPVGIETAASTTTTTTTTAEGL